MAKKKQSKKQPLQEIYGDADSDPEETGPDSSQLTTIISELKSTYGDSDWTRHIIESLISGQKDG